MEITRKWSMPNSRTFKIKPIKELIENELVDKGIIIDPFANECSIRDIIHNKNIKYISNDLDEQYPTDFHMDALDFLKQFDDESVDMILYDPPYSPRQVSECYKNLNKTVNMATTQASYWSNHKREIGRILKPNGKVITFGWNSGGIGKKYGLKIHNILLVPHGGWHNDTICTVEIKEE